MASSSPANAPELVQVEFPTQLLGTLGKSILFTFSNTLDEVRVIFSQNDFLLSDERKEKVVGKDEFHYRFTSGDNRRRKVKIQALEAKSEVRRVTFSVFDGQEGVIRNPEEVLVTVSPYWKLLEYIYLRPLWEWIPRGVRRVAAYLVTGLFLAAIILLPVFRESLPDRLRERLHLAPVDLFGGNITEWTDYFDQSQPRLWYVWKSKPNRLANRDGYLEISGFAMPRLDNVVDANNPDKTPYQAVRDTLYRFHAWFTILLDDKTDVVSWLLRARPNYLGPNPDRPVRWSGYLFQVVRPPSGSPYLRYFICSGPSKQQCTAIYSRIDLPGGDRLKELTVETHAEYVDGLFRFRVSAWLNGIRQDVANFEDKEERFHWGTIAFLSIDEDNFGFQVEKKFILKSLIIRKRDYEAPK